jgi:hypothetical protein
MYHFSEQFSVPSFRYSFIFPLISTCREVVILQGLFALSKSYSARKLVSGKMEPA